MSGGQPPDGQVRRSQLLFGSGPGALVDLVEDAAIVGGLEMWRYSHDDEGFLQEPRLSDKARTLLSMLPRWKDRTVRLRLPPDCSTQDASRARGIGVGRFPKWFLCQNHLCRSLVRLSALDGANGRKHVCVETSRKSSPVVALRFVAACPDGHVQDIDWEWFVHRERSGEQHGRYRDWCTRARNAVPNDPLGEDWTASLAMRQVGTTGDLADYVLVCRKCGRQRGFQDLAQKQMLGKCRGERPWLPGDSAEPCDQHLKLLTRTASNAYFSTTISVLSIPDPAEELRKAVESIWDRVEDATPETWAIVGANRRVREVLGRFATPDVLTEIERRRRDLPVQSLPIRELEWQQLMAQPYEQPGELPKPNEPLFARRVDLPLPPFIERVVLVKHLTEVRAQLGFTRIEPVIGDEENEFVLSPRTAAMSLDADWIPAIPILGEGIFIALDSGAIDRWLNQPESSPLRRRELSFRRGSLAFNERRDTAIPFPGLRLVMLHTLSHMLINSIALECGYAASSIRERLYCRAEERDGAFVTTRAGILLTTGSPGSEGTLGGLVEIGRDIERHLRRAAERALLCSNDPVCALHLPDDPQEGRFREGAACHGCVLIGEPSCERMNQELDRSLVVPVVDAQPGVAFLESWVESWR